VSLVNDMLRDLDRRGKQSQQVRRVNDVFRSRTVAAPRHNPLLVAALASLSVVAGLGGGYLLFAGETAPQPAAEMALPMLPAAVAAMPAPVIEETVVAPVPVVLDVVRQSNARDGFSLRLSANGPVTYRVANRSATGISLYFDGIASVASRPLDIPGLSLVQSEGRVELDYDNDTRTMFQVYEDSDTTEFDVVLSASWQLETAAAPVQPALSFEAVPALNPPVDTAAVRPDLAALPPVAPAAIGTTSVEQIRTTRELTLDQRDAMVSQQAATLVRDGRLLEAYQLLLEFVDNTPQAHLSRETLATVLMAQHELVQAASVVDAGLQLVPNYAPFKKIKARLLMQESRNAEALQLMSSVPPAVSDDLEYYELLATLYQQNGRYDLAISTYQELLRRDSSQGRWWAGMAITLEAQQKFKEALASYQAALQTVNLDPNLRQYAQSKAQLLSSVQ